MDPTLAASLATGSGSIIGDIANIFQQKKNRKFAEEQASKERAFNRSMEDQAWNRNIEAWNMQNEYNDPQAQMSRLKRAGLNPNLMYGKGTVGNAGEIAKYNAPQGSFPSPPIAMPGLNALSEATKDYFNIRLMQEQIKNTSADTDKKFFESATEQERQQQLMYQNLVGDYLWNNQPLGKSRGNREIDARIKKAEQDAEFIRLRKNWQTMMNNAMDSGVNLNRDNFMTRAIFQNISKQASFIKSSLSNYWKSRK